MQITDQKEEHAPAVERLLDIAFGPDRNGKTVYRLREGVDPAPGLSLVIENGAGLAATLRFWPVALPGGKPALLLGPIAVRPDLAGKGYGKGLMLHGIERARAAGWTAILLVGDAPYYGPLGFSRAAARNLQLPGPVDAARFLAMELIPGALDGVAGMVSKAVPDAAA